MNELMHIMKDKLGEIISSPMQSSLENLLDDDLYFYLDEEIKHLAMVTDTKLIANQLNNLTL